jgi:hypothetical protein
MHISLILILHLNPKSISHPVFLQMYGTICRHLLRHEHAHVLLNVICNGFRCYATIKCAKQGADLTAIGTGSLSIGRFRIQAFICRDDELQHSLLGLSPLTARGCTAEFTNKFFKLHHAACLQPILVGYKYLRPTLWRITIPPVQRDPTSQPRTRSASDPFLEDTHDEISTTNLECDKILDHSAPGITVPTTLRLPRIPLHSYKDYSYAKGDARTIAPSK